jgi:hypothetical protein
MSSTDEVNVTSIGAQVEYRLQHARTSSLGAMVEYTNPGITAAGVMVEYLELDTLPLLAVGQYYGGS